MDDLDPDLDLSENSIHKYYEEASTASDSMTILDDYAILGFPNYQLSYDDNQDDKLYPLIDSHLV